MTSDASGKQYSVAVVQLGTFTVNQPSSYSFELPYEIVNRTDDAAQAKLIGIEPSKRRNRSRGGAK